MYSVANAAKELGLSRYLIYDWIEKGVVKTIKHPLSGRIMIEDGELERIRNIVTAEKKEK
jgi:predicted site-specific integrase-resolvase